MNIRRLGPLVAFVVLLSAPAALGAHTKLQKSEPASDSTVTGPLKTIQIWFSEAPDTKVSKVEVIGPKGPLKIMGLHAMEKSLMVMIDGTAPDGLYTVNWQSAGDDGHVQKGDFKFTLKAAK